jgi:lipoyl(octanoyl) transferase
MPHDPPPAEDSSPALQAYLLGQIDFGRCLELQQRLLEEIGGRGDGGITLLLCEHPAVITVGRGGSAADLALESTLLRSGQIEVGWVNRGGGSLMHCPGQLAVYPLVPLRWHGFSVGDYLERLQAGIVETLDDLGVRGHTPPGRHGVWGRTGQLAALGVAVRNWVTYYGAYVNVCPSLGLMRLVQSDPAQQTRMSSLVAERCGPAKMTAVRAALVGRLSEALGCDRYHLHTGHPLLRENAGRDTNGG